MRNGHYHNNFYLSYSAIHVFVEYNISGKGIFPQNINYIYSLMV